MPRLNLRDKSSDFQAHSPDPTGSDPSSPVNDYEDEGGRKTPWIVLGAVIVALAVLLVALNQFNVIHLWGKKPARVVETAADAGRAPVESPAAPEAGVGSSQAVTDETTPLPTESGSGAPASRTGERGRRSAAAGSGGTAQTAEGGVSGGGVPSPGSFAVQVVSWPTRNGADRVASRLGAEGFNAYVVEGDVDGKTWYRVRVGKYATSAEANAAVSQLAEKGFEGAMVMR